VCLFAAVAFAAEPPARGTSAAGAGSILLRDGFEEGLAGWVQAEGAGFAPETPAQIGSTIATHFTDAKDAAGREYHYKILAVDTSGNASRS
jgi:hypothetical protein